MYVVRASRILESQSDKVETARRDKQDEMLELIGSVAFPHM